MVRDKPKNSKFGIPLVVGVAISDEPIDSSGRNILKLFRGVPRLLERILNRRRWQMEVG
ncbi:MAG: hypothetical protein HYY45_22295 [Deltaproteobacteria bacterium]|nr:hypothetical protein [Deltaproteobacteria bacterium]